MSRNNPYKLKNFKTTLTKPKETQAFITNNTLYNSKAMKTSIGTFNKSIEHLNSIAPYKTIKPIISQSHTVKQHSTDFTLKRQAPQQASAGKDILNTNYIINNFTLSTKNLAQSQGQSEPNETLNNQRENRIKTLCRLIAKKDQQIEELNHKVKVKDMIINEQKGKIDVLHHKYSKSKKSNAEIEEDNAKLRQLNSVLEVAEKDLKEIMRILSEKKVYVEVSEEGESERRLMAFEEYLNEFVDAEEEGDEMTLSSERNECESASFTPLNIDPVKSLKRLDVIPKLNFNKIYMKTDSSHWANKNKTKAKVKEKKKKRIEAHCNNEHSEIGDEPNKKVKDKSENIGQVKERILNTIQASLKMDSQIFKRNLKASHKHFLRQSNHSKSFSGKLSKMIKASIFTHIQSKYHKAPHQFK